MPFEKNIFFFLKNTSIPFLINSTRIITDDITLNYYSKTRFLFFQHWNQQATSCPRPQCLVGQIQVQMPIPVVAANHMPDYNDDRE